MLSLVVSSGSVALTFSLLVAILCVDKGSVVCAADSADVSRFAAIVDTAAVVTYVDEDKVVLEGRVLLMVDHERVLHGLSRLSGKRGLQPLVK